MENISSDDAVMESLSKTTTAESQRPESRSIAKVAGREIAGQHFGSIDLLEAEIGFRKGSFSR